MTPSNNCIDVIKQFEGLRLNAYLDQVGVPTIGYGSTFYKGGEKVKMGDKITKDQANELLLMVVTDFAKGVDDLIKSKVNQNQFDSLVSFAYNVGLGALAKSTLLKKVNQNPNDPSIEAEFMKYNKGRVKGVLQPLPGLSKRRQQESDLYFKP